MRLLRAATRDDALHLGLPTYLAHEAIPARTFLFAHRMGKPGEFVRAMFEAGWGPFVLWRDASLLTRFPLPAHQHFEPIELRSTETELAGLIRATTPDALRPQRSDLIERGAIFVIFIFLLLPASAILQTLFQQASLDFQSIWLAIRNHAEYLAGAIAILVLRLLRRRWFIFPGGSAAVPRLRVGLRPAVFLASECGVEIDRGALDQQSVFIATADGKRRIKRTMSAYELAAFLAAWQSPLPPPDEATIRAYFGGE